MVFKKFLISIIPYNSQSSFSLRYLYIPNDIKSDSSHTSMRYMLIFLKVILYKQENWQGISNLTVKVTSC